MRTNPNYSGKIYNFDIQQNNKQNANAINNQDTIIRTHFSKLTAKIYVRKTADTHFESLVEKALKKISSKEAGRRLIQKIDAGKHDVQIVASIGYNEIIALDQNYNKKGVGCRSAIFLDPKMKAKDFGRDGNWIETHFFINLAHELIHAHHNSRGKNLCDQKTIHPEIWTNDEECHTILGFPSKTTFLPSSICENAIRREHNLPERYSHLGFYYD